MSSASSLLIIDPEDNGTLVVSQPKSGTVEENKRMRLRILKMWDAWSNGRELPSTILIFPS